MNASEKIEKKNKPLRILEHPVTNGIILSLCGKVTRIGSFNPRNEAFWVCIVSGFLVSYLSYLMTYFTLQWEKRRLRKQKKQEDSWV